jgi:RES domain-containing protein
MYLYRIVKSKARARDLSGMGAYQTGGRWNSKGTYMLYTSENSSLAYLENLVHFDEVVSPPQLYIVQLQLDDNAPLYTVPDSVYPPDWLKLGLLENKALGDKWMNQKKYIAIKLRSAINISEYNYLLNPLFPGFHNLVKIISVNEIPLDDRLVE